MTQSRHYAAHLREIQQRYDEALEATGFDAVVIGAGLPVPVFRDDQDYPAQLVHDVRHDPEASPRA